MKKPIVPPLLGLSFGILAASTSSIFIRMAQEQAPSIAIAAFRLTFATLLLAPFVLSRRWNELRALKSRQMWLMSLSGVLLALHFATWISSLEFTSVASSVVLVTTSPLWVALLSPLVLKESLKKQAIIGLAVAMLGSILVALAEGCQIGNNGVSCDAFSEIWSGKAMWGNFLALAGAWCAAGYLLIGRQVRANISLASYAFGVYGVAAVTLLALVGIFKQNLIGYPIDLYGWCLLLAIFPQLLGHSSFNWALKYISANLVSLVLLGEPVASVILAVILLKEIPTIVEIVGGVTILLGIYLATRSD